MPERCRACTHPKRTEINRSILQEGLSDAAVGAMYGLSRMSVFRHRQNHLVFSKEAASEAANVLTIIGYANDLYGRATALLTRAEGILDASPDSARGVQAAAASLREVRASIELLAKLIVSEGPAPTTEANQALDRQITEALEALVMPALPSGPALESDIAEAEVVTQ